MSKYLLIISTVLLSISMYGQNTYVTQLEDYDIELDSLDKSWLTENSSFLIDMASLAKMDTTAMNRAIIQMSTKLLSNKLTEISKEESLAQKELITKIIYGALDQHGLGNEKKLSAMSWYNMIVKEIGI